MHDHARHRKRSALVAALLANLGYFGLQVVAAIVFGSLTLVADAVHNLSDVMALGLAAAAVMLATRPPSARLTFGFARAEVLAALANAALLFAASLWIAVEAIGRFGDTGAISGAGVTLVGAGGILVNVWSAWILKRSAGSDLGIRAVFWHLVGDTLSSFAAIVAGVAIMIWDATWVDPAASLFVTVLIMISAVRLLRDTGHVLLEGVPEGIDVDAIEAALESVDGVEGVHHTHVWSIGTDSVALSTHVELAGEPTLHDAQISGDALKVLLADRFGIDHTTLELECHGCADDRDHAT